MRQNIANRKKYESKSLTRIAGIHYTKSKLVFTPVYNAVDKAIAKCRIDELHERVKNIVDKASQQENSDLDIRSI